MYTIKISGSHNFYHSFQVDTKEKVIKYLIDNEKEISEDGKSINVDNGRIDIIHIRNSQNKRWIKRIKNYKDFSRLRLELASWK